MISYKTVHGRKSKMFQTMLIDEILPFIIKIIQSLILLTSLYIKKLTFKY